MSVPGVVVVPLPPLPFPFPVNLPWPQPIPIRTPQTTKRNNNANNDNTVNKKNGGTARGKMATARSRKKSTSMNGSGTSRPSTTSSLSSVMATATNTSRSTTAPSTARTSTSVGAASYSRPTSSSTAAAAAANKLTKTSSTTGKKPTFHHRAGRQKRQTMTEKPKTKSNKKNGPNATYDGSDHMFDRTHFGAASSDEQSLWHYAVEDAKSRRPHGVSEQHPHQRNKSPTHLARPHDLTHEQRMKLLSETHQKRSFSSKGSQSTSQLHPDSQTSRRLDLSSARSASDLRTLSARHHASANASVSSLAFEKPNLYVHTHSLSSSSSVATTIETFSPKHEFASQTQPATAQTAASSSMASGSSSSPSLSLSPSPSPVTSPRRHRAFMHTRTHSSPSFREIVHSPRSADLLALVNQLENDLRTRLGELATEFEHVKKRKADRERNIERMQQVEQLLTSFPHSSAVRDAMLAILTSSIGETNPSGPTFPVAASFRTSMTNTPASDTADIGALSATIAAQLAALDSQAMGQAKKVSTAAPSSSSSSTSTTDQPTSSDASIFIDATPIAATRPRRRSTKSRVTSATPDPSWLRGGEEFDVNNGDEHQQHSSMRMASNIQYGGMNQLRTSLSQPTSRLPSAAPSPMQSPTQTPYQSSPPSHARTISNIELSHMHSSSLSPDVDVTAATTGTDAGKHRPSRRARSNSHRLSNVELDRLKSGIILDLTSPETDTPDGDEVGASVTDYNFSLNQSIPIEDDSLESSNYALPSSSPPSSSVSVTSSAPPSSAMSALASVVGGSARRSLIVTNTGTSEDALANGISTQPSALTSTLAPTSTSTSQRAHSSMLPSSTTSTGTFEVLFAPSLSTRANGNDHSTPSLASSFPITASLPMTGAPNGFSFDPSTYLDGAIDYVESSDDDVDDDIDVTGDGSGGDVDSVLSLSDSVPTTPIAIAPVANPTTEFVSPPLPPPFPQQLSPVHSNSIDTASPPPTPMMTMFVQPPRPSALSFVKAFTNPTLSLIGTSGSLIAGR